MSTEEMNEAKALAEVISDIPAEASTFLHGVVVGMRQANRSMKKEVEENAES